MWGVLEHVNNPLVLLKKLSLYLKRNGFIMLETPNAESLLMQYSMLQNKSSILRFLEPARHNKVVKNILSIQSIIDQCKMSDHYRILLQKK